MESNLPACASIINKFFVFLLVSFLTKATQKMKVPNILYVGKSDDVFLALNTYVFGTQYILAIINRTTRKMTLKVITMHIPIFSTPLGPPPPPYLDLQFSLEMHCLKLIHIMAKRPQDLKKNPLSLVAASNLSKWYIHIFLQIFGLLISDFELFKVSF